MTSLRFKRGLVLMGLTLCLANLISGGPALALWLGAQLAEGQMTLTMGMMVSVLALLVAIEGLLVWAAVRLETIYAQLSHKRSAPARAAWLRSLRDSPAADAHAMTATDQIAAVIVALAVIALEAWFFLAAGSPLG